MEDERYKKKGYLLVDIVLALALVSILFLGIGKSYRTYINNNYYIKEKIKVVEIINSLAMELKYNTSFEDLRRIDSGIYKIDDLNVNDLINNDIEEVLRKNLILNSERNYGLGWTINIIHVDQYESIINIIYKNEKPYISENKEVKIYKFLEKSPQKLEKLFQKEEEKHIY
ncbi:type II secretion system protein [Clostridium sp.]|uniref:type II secretion system protein n=1 Tax=Clostridium sp. TaxID=1506 RepID=UPI002611C822